MYKHTHSENVFDYKNNYANEHNMNSFYDIEFHWSKCSVDMAKSNKTLHCLTNDVLRKQSLRRPSTEPQCPFVIIFPHGKNLFKIILALVR